MMILHAHGLASKWGFNDGDMPDDVEDALFGRGVDPDRVDWHGVLRVLVRRYLAPELPDGVEVYDIETLHNPVRTDAWGDPYDIPDAPDIWVRVSLEQILGAVQEVQGTVPLSPGGGVSGGQCLAGNELSR